MDYQTFLKLSKKELMHIIIKATQQAQAERYKERMEKVKWHLANTNVKTVSTPRLTTNSKANVRSAGV